MYQYAVAFAFRHYTGTTTKI